MSDIRSKSDFGKFLEQLFNDYKSNPDTWVNTSLNDFLEALCAYNEDIEGYYKNNNIEYDLENPKWQNFADLLSGARIYE